MRLIQAIIEVTFSFLCGVFCVYTLIAAIIFAASVKW